MFGSSFILIHTTENARLTNAHMCPAHMCIANVCEGQIISGIHSSCVCACALVEVFVAALFHGIGIDSLVGGMFSVGPVSTQMTLLVHILR